MDRHLGEALVLIEEGSSLHNAKIREEMKQFFAMAELIEKEIAKNEVSSLNTVKNRELMAIREQTLQVQEFLDRFQEQILEIEGRIRGVLAETSPLLDMNPVSS